MQNQGNQCGFGLLLVLLGMALTVLTFGFAIDAGHLYVVEGALQDSADQAALTAARELDGTWNGIWRAKRAAAAGLGDGMDSPPELFGSLAIHEVRSAFATKPAGGWTLMPASPENYRFVQVNATSEARLFFLSMIPSVGQSRRVTVRAVAGQRAVRAAGEGLAPFSPAAPDPMEANFGFTPGGTYPLAGVSPGRGNGYIDVGQTPDEAGAEDAVVNGSFYLDRAVAVGRPVKRVDRPVALRNALQRRFLQDTDTGSTNYLDYAGNGRRILVVPVNDGSERASVVGFAAFLIQADSCRGSRGPCYASYVGPSPVLHGKALGAGPPGLYDVTLFR